MQKLVNTLQTICIMIVSAGIVTELVFRAEVGFLFITVGTFAFAISTKLHK